MTWRFALLFACASCTLDRAWPIDDCASHACCGNGRLDTGEACDDGNRSRWDGCAATCDVEGSASCRGQPSVCYCDSAASPDGFEILRSLHPLVVDGVLNEWGGAGVIDLGIPGPCSRASVRFLWDTERLYVGAEVRDAYLGSVHTEPDSDLWEDDSVELFFDTLADGGSGRADDFKLLVSSLNTRADFSWGADWNPSWVSVTQAIGTHGDDGDVDVGYNLELAITWSAWGIAAPVADQAWGMDIKLNDRVASEQLGWATWVNQTGGPPNDPDGWGHATFSSDHAGN